MMTTWLVENRVAYVDTEQIITQHDVIILNRTLIEYCDQATHGNVHIIYNNMALQQFVTNIAWLRQTLTVISHPYRGYNISITTNNVLRYLGAIVYKVAGKATPRIVSSYSDAISCLVQLDPSLPELPLHPVVR